MIFTKNIYRVHSVWRGIQNEENERRHKRRLYFGWKRILETEITHPERGSLITISIFALPPSFQKNQSSKITKPGADKSNQKKEAAGRVYISSLAEFPSAASVSDTFFFFFGFFPATAFFSAWSPKKFTTL